MDERQLNENESLELISRMIRNTQQNLEKESGIPFLVWGYITVFVSLSVWMILSKTDDYLWHLLWFLIPAIGWPLMHFLIRKKEKEVKTYVDKVISYVWISFGIAALLTSITAIFFWKIPVLFIILLLISTGTVITGMIIRFKIIITVGFIGMLLSFICLFVPGLNQILIFAGAFLVMMIIPGHILNAKGRR